METLVQLFYSNSSSFVQALGNTPKPSNTNGLKLRHIRDKERFRYDICLGYQLEHQLSGPPICALKTDIRKAVTSE